jgi:copper chaperone CopZ
MRVNVFHYCVSVLGMALLVALHGSGCAPSAQSVEANQTNLFTVEGMHCDGCAETVEVKLLNAKGVGSASVSFSNGTATVSYDTNLVAPEKLQKTIEALGYTVSLTD